MSLALLCAFCFLFLPPFATIDNLIMLATLSLNDYQKHTYWFSKIKLMLPNKPFSFLTCKKFQCNLYLKCVMFSFIFKTVWIFFKCKIFPKIFITKCKLFLQYRVTRKLIIIIIIILQYICARFVKKNTHLKNYMLSAVTIHVNM